jgi:3-hydroxyisobutyrate dehydrogenase-like beta-hydroxyacid dehydrogenase
MLDAVRDLSSPGPDPARIGIVGLGRMGGGIARRLADCGRQLTVWNRSPGKAQALAAEASCAIARTVAELAAESDIVISSLADSHAVQAVFLDDEVLAALDGKLFIEMSTVGPSFSAGLARALAQAGVRFVEAPVSGSTAAARNGQLLVLAGADEAVAREARPVLDLIARSVRFTGAPGSAALCKLALNLVVFGMNEAVAEALVFAERGGMDPAVFYDALCDSAVRAPVLEYRREAFLSPDGAEVTFALDLARKDLQLIAREAGALDAPVPQTIATLQVAEEAASAGFGQADVAAVALHLRRRAAS